MASLRYLGPPGSSGLNVLTKLHADATVEGDVNATYVTDQAQARRSSLATVEYVTDQAGMYVTPADISSQMSSRIARTQRGVNNGIAELNAQGRLPNERVPAQGSGTYRGPFPVNMIWRGQAMPGNPLRIFEWNIPAPGFWWRPLVFGTVQARYTGSGGRPDVEVRIGTTTNGAIVGTGRGSNLSTAWQGVPVIPAPSGNGQSGVPVTGYSDTTSVLISGWLVNGFNNASDPVEMTANNYIRNMTLYLMKIA